MKRYISILLLGFCLTLWSGCTKESMEGPVGTKGPEGDPGAKGEQGEPGEGVSNVRRFEFTIERGSGFYNANTNPTGVWAGRTTGMANNAAAYTISPDQIGGLDINNPNFLIIAYAKIVDSNYPIQQKVLLPFTFYAFDGEMKIEFVRDLPSGLGEIHLSKKPSQSAGLTNPKFAEMPKIMNIELNFIEIGNKTY